MKINLVAEHKNKYIKETTQSISSRDR